MIVRHPETLANVESRYIGRVDSPISERGMRQTSWLARVVEPWGADVLYTSPLGRARSTAEAIAPAGVPLATLEELGEIDFGLAEGLTYDEIAAAGIPLDYVSGGPIAPEGETGAAFDERVRRAAELIARGPARSVVVTHGGVVRRLLVHWLSLPVETAWRFAVPNASILVVRVADGNGVLESLTPPPDLSEDRA
jgi:broad specificity phosphatase PhoE